MIKENSIILQNILKILPPMKRIKLYSEADFYGVSSFIAKKLKFPFRLFSFIGWKHGWLYADLKFKEQLTGGSDYPNYLVANKKEELFLMENNVKAKAVGMPFIYIVDVETEKVKRHRNTLLVMPPHSLPYTEHEWGEEAYVQKICELSNQFELVVACVHQSCFEKGLWIETFEKYGIKCISGADVNDENALRRMYRLFNSFEYMTTK